MPVACVVVSPQLGTIAYSTIVRGYWAGFLLAKSAERVVVPAFTVIAPSAALRPVSVGATAWPDALTSRAVGNRSAAASGNPTTANTARLPGGCEPKRWYTHGTPSPHGGSVGLIPLGRSMTSELATLSSPFSGFQVTCIVEIPGTPFDSGAVYPGSSVANWSSGMPSSL